MGLSNHVEMQRKMELLRENDSGTDINHLDQIILSFPQRTGE
jgi:Fe-S cluster assembly ATPase SufC